MSKVADIYNQMLALLAATFPDAQRIWNPYELEQTPSLILQHGYAVTMGTADNPNTLQSCAIMPKRLMALALTREVASEVDADSRVSVEIQLLEDQLTFLKVVSANSDLIGNAQMTSDSGIEFVTTPDSSGKFFLLTTIFSFTYTESLT